MQATFTWARPMLHHPIGHLVQAISAGAALLVAQSVPDAISWTQTVERLGLAVALVLFFVYTGWQREKRMGKRIDYLEKQMAQQGSRLAGMAETWNETIRSNADVLRKAIEVLEGRTCVAFANHEEFERWQQTKGTP